MRKDNITAEALEKAYLIFAERGHQTQDFSHTPTDYARGTVLEPEAESVVIERYKELAPAEVMSGGEYEQLESQSHALNMEIDKLQFQMKQSRRLGAFQELQMQMRRIKELIKEKERLDAKMAVTDLTRKQMDDYNRTYDPETSYAEALEDLSSKIADLQERIKNQGA